MKNTLIIPTEGSRFYRGPFWFSALALPRFWIGGLWLLILIAATCYQFWLGYRYNSNETTNLYLSLARGSSYALLVILAVLWLPVMRNTLSWLRRSRIGLYLPLNRNRHLHRWLGHGMMALAVLHGSQYLVYFDTLETPFTDTLIGSESDMVRSMRTTMYEFVSEDESIDLMADWIAQGAPRSQYETDIHPFLQEDCIKCHSRSSTQTWAVQDIPLATYEEVLGWTKSGVASKQFRINASGVVMLVLALVIWFFSLGTVRRKAYHRFQRVHRLGYPLVALLVFHLPGSLIWLQVPLALLILEIYLSRYKNLYRNCEAQLVTEPEGEIVRLIVKCPRSLDIKAGHYVQVRIADLNPKEWHPFSLTGPRESQDQLVLKIRCRGDWTRQLAELGNSRLQVDLRGPYASPVTLARHSNSYLMLAGGIGITPFLGLLRHLLNHSGSASNVHLVWVLKEPHMIRWLQPLLTHIARHPELSCHWHLYLTSSAEHQIEWLSNLPNNLQVNLNQGRPDWPGLMSHISQSSPSPDCFICGPDSFAKQAASACHARRWRVTQEHF